MLCFSKIEPKRHHKTQIVVRASGTFPPMALWTEIKQERHDEWIQASENTVRYAQLVRNHHAKRLKRSNPQRQQDIDAALKRIASTMKPIRSYLGRMPGLAQDHPIRKASFALQRERRKLWKMQDRMGQSN